LETGLLDEGGEDVVGCEADTMASLLEGGAEGDEGLDVAAAADYLDDDVEFDVERRRLDGVINGWEKTVFWGLGNESR
jgi:hypothetical protein